MGGSFFFLNIFFWDKIKTNVSKPFRMDKTNHIKGPKDERSLRPKRRQTNCFKSKLMRNEGVLHIYDIYIYMYIYYEEHSHYQLASTFICLL